MTKQEKQKQFIVEKAFKQGKKIQFKKHTETKWLDIPAETKIVIWDWNTNDYQIKQK